MSVSQRDCWAMPYFAIFTVAIVSSFKNHKPKYARERNEPNHSNRTMTQLQISARVIADGVLGLQHVHTQC